MRVATGKLGPVPPATLPTPPSQPINLEPTARKELPPAARPYWCGVREGLMEALEIASKVDKGGAVEQALKDRLTGYGIEEAAKRARKL